MHSNDTVAASHTVVGKTADKNVFENVSSRNTYTGYTHKQDLQTLTLTDLLQSAS